MRRTRIVELPSGVGKPTIDASAAAAGVDLWDERDAAALVQAALRTAERDAYSTLSAIEADIDAYNAVSEIGLR